MVHETAIIAKTVFLLNKRIQAVGIVNLTAYSLG